MIDQTWSSNLNKRVQEWEQAFEEWAMLNGMTNPIEWIKANGMPSSNPELSAAYKTMIRENMKKAPALRAEYSKINPCPVRRFPGK